MKNSKKLFKAFSRAEMIVVILIFTVVLAVLIPIIQKHVKIKPANKNVTLPIATESGTCNSNLPGISSDGKTLLKCKSGHWAVP